MDTQGPTVGTQTDEKEFNETVVKNESKTKGNNWIGDVLTGAPEFLNKLEKNFPFTSTILGLVGYIVISSTGNLDTFGKYIMYFVFLSLLFFIYKIQIDSIKFHIKDYLYQLAIAILTLFIFFQNWNLIKNTIILTFKNIDKIYTNTKK